ncbi:MAG: hypothetical protein M1834_005146 [Cirrosporium novae-zelandiae]|nr:MAG: hypothetical protein M1834_005146 [Cirrosporium novae-zelandiae]
MASSGSTSLRSISSPAMSASTKAILTKVRSMVPPMLERFHKGQLGRVAVIGGSQDYTGAPYFSAMASARLGCDMSHVICEPEAAQVIKTYSPNLMVHPYMRQSHKSTQRDEASAPDTPAKIIIAMLSRLHVLVIGPGLGRDPLMLDTCATVIEAAKRENMPFVLDADGLYLVQTRPELVRGYDQCILTPNVVEFGRLARACGVDISGPGEKVCAKLANALGGVMIIQKGRVDYISNGKETWVSDVVGGLKRSGGQGDTLTGTLGTFLAWRKAYLDKIWDIEGDMNEKETLMLAAFGGSVVTRECSRLAFMKRGRSLQAEDLTEEVKHAFENMIGEVSPPTRL